VEAPLWTPTEERIANANVTHYSTWLKNEKDLDLPDYRSLWEWSVSERADFWQSLWEYFDVVSSKDPDEVLVDGGDMISSRWFVEARMNFAENLLRFPLGMPSPYGGRHTIDRDPDVVEALVYTSESGVRRSVTYNELLGLVARTAAALRRDGVVEGDRIAGFMPNMIESVVGMLAAASIGAIWSSCSPDFGIKGVFDRFGQIEPKVLFTADGYLYNGKEFDSLERVKEVMERIPSIERVVVVPHLAWLSEEVLDVTSVPNAVTFDDYMGDGPAPELDFAQLPFDHPVYIMYSSGTTGVPKCIVHGAGGTLLQHSKELALHTDIGPSDRVFYFTTCGWMMWNWLVSSLSLGATVLLYDGNPFHPDPGRLFKLADDECMTVFGTSARYLSAVEKTGLIPRSGYDLGTLKAICSTGSPLSIESFGFVYRDVKRDLDLASIAGGTDLISCFGLGNPTLPVWPGELQVRGLGMKVDSFDDDGGSVRGGQGELVCTASFPSQPVFFWNDPENEKYHEAYFDVYPNVWRHGDFVEITEHDGIVFLGRSDSTLNPGGVRIGTAEIYRQVMTMGEVVDSVVIGQDWDDDTRVVLFVVLSEGLSLNEDLVKMIKTTIRSNTTPRHVPAVILQVPDIPRTISGKKVEMAVRKVVHGQEVKNKDALANPEALDHFRDLDELM
jgi:acetoacetyl-CoA synthetase